MNRFNRILASSLLALVAAPSAVLADVRLPAIFSDHMVLQQQKAAAVWGWADAGEEVTVSVDKATATTKAGTDGKWTAKLDKLPAGGPFTLIVKGRNTLTVKDVLVGEVWLCSGQSNMAMTVNRSNDFEKEQAAATNKLIRMYTVPRNPQRAPVDDAKGTWVVCAPESVGLFSAAGYFFGREIQPALQVPVGLINSSYGGTDIAAWTSEEVQLPIPALKAQFEDWAKKDATYDPAKAQAAFEKAQTAWKAKAAEAKAAGKPAPRAPAKPNQPSKDQNHPANLYNGMIVPVMPYTIRGAIWYQGEHNSRNAESGTLYATQMALLIKDWRTRWGDDFAFGIVQLPNFARPGEGWMLVRESMLKTVQTVPNTGLAITVDVGDPGDIHPKDKQTVGKRLANWALATVYGKSDVAAMGPLPAGHEIKGGSIVLKFTHAHGGLVAKGGTLTGFTIAGEDRKFVPAVAKIEGDTVVVSSPDVAKPTAVRYAWQDNPVCNLFNGAGLPASPFRTDQ
ncbi:sialate O-acetylesterase [Humisphaera borealis]|uniref:Sialate O-acetylesterase n=1 Tax=Humisphaera borealis TaxID=2807512 RepID=A0A7M2WZ77_9BACT|nr:sialate O-acetylesterase [Humisphaera borealis]QOV89790.1 sialate O-acetylesterase [Humisphaera borealis]